MQLMPAVGRKGGKEVGGTAAAATAGATATPAPRRTIHRCPVQAGGEPPVGHLEDPPRVPRGGGQLHDERGKHSRPLFSVLMCLEVAARLVEHQLVQDRRHGHVREAQAGGHNLGGRLLERRVPAGRRRHVRRGRLPCPAHRLVNDRLLAVAIRRRLAHGV